MATTARRLPAPSRIEIGGTQPGTEYDVVEVDGDALLAGELQVELIDLGGGSFTPALEDLFTVLTTTGSRLGTFDSTALPDVGPLLNFRVLYQPEAVALAVVPALAGDYNADGLVNTTDYTCRVAIGSVSATATSHWLQQGTSSYREVEPVRAKSVFRFGRGSVAKSPGLALALVSPNREW